MRGLRMTLLRPRMSMKVAAGLPTVTPAPRFHGERESRDVGDMDTRFRGYDEEYFHGGYHRSSVTDTPKWSEARLSVIEKSLAFRSGDSHI